MNEIEQALIAAFEDPNPENQERHQDHFYQTLIDSAVFVLVPKKVKVAMDPDTNEVVGLEIVRAPGRDGKEWIPFFSSPGFAEKLPDTFRQFGKAKLTSRQFFKIVQATKCIMNPNSELRMEFEPDTIRALLNGQVFAKNGTRAIDEEDVLTFMDPAEIPAGLLDGIKDHVQRTKEIKSGYLALKRSNKDNEIACVLLIETAGNKQAVVDALGKVTAPFRQKYPYMDIVFDQDGDAAKEIKAQGFLLKEKKSGFFSRILGS